MQWTADVTEHAHVTEIKQPARSGNNQNYHTQIVRHLDRSERCLRFDITTHFASVEEDGSEEDDEAHEDEHEPDPETSNMKCYHLPSRTHVNYFEVSKAITGGVVSTSVLPPRTFSSSTTAFHLALKPSLRISIDEAAELYGLPDLRSTVTDYFHHASRSGCPVVENIQAWFKVRVQQPTYHSRESFQSPQSLIASPPSTQSPSGRYDFAVVNQSDESEWPSKGLEGMFCCVVRCPAIYSLCYRAYNCTGSPNLSRPLHRLFSCVCSMLESYSPPSDM